jgi:methionyl-tRNA formyltransferase
MRAVILTSRGPEHTFVTNALLNAVGDRVVAIVLESRRSSLNAGLRRYGPLRTCERIVTKAGRAMMGSSARQAAALRDVLGSYDRQWPPSLPVVETPSANSAEIRATIKGLAPTHLFVYGTGIVGAGTASLTHCALNLHTGLSPWYRGSDTEFWPLYYGKPEMVGITVHQVTPAVDAGPIYARASVRLAPDDDPYRAFARCVHVGAGVYADVARRLAAGEMIDPIPQDLHLGRSYRFVDRTLWHDIVMRFRVRKGKIRNQIEGVTGWPFPFSGVP